MHEGQSCAKHLRPVTSARFLTFFRWRVPFDGTLEGHDDTSGERVDSRGKRGHVFILVSNGISKGSKREYDKNKDMTPHSSLPYHELSCFQFWHKSVLEKHTGRFADELDHIEESLTDLGGLVSEACQRQTPTLEGLERWTRALEAKLKATAPSVFERP